MFPFPRNKKVVSFLVSGSGMLFSSVAEQIINNRISARIGAVITDNGSAGVLRRAGKLKVPAHIVEHSRFSSREEQEREVMRLLQQYDTDLIVAAGYLRLFSGNFVARYRNRIINIHPSLLPSFPGVYSQRKAIDYGVKVAGCTSHFVDEGVDTGPIIMQATVHVFDKDTVESISARILKEEFRVLSESVRLFCEGKLDVSGRIVSIRHNYFRWNLLFRPFSRIWNNICSPPGMF